MKKVSVSTLQVLSKKYNTGSIKRISNWSRGSLNLSKKSIYPHINEKMFSCSMNVYKSWKF